MCDETRVGRPLAALAAHGDVFTGDVFSRPVSARSFGSLARSLARGGGLTFLRLATRVLIDSLRRLAEVGQIKSWMSSFRQNITAIEECYGQYVTSVTNEQTKEASDKLDELIDDTNALTHKIRGA